MLKAARSASRITLVIRELKIPIDKDIHGLVKASSRNERVQVNVSMGSCGLSVAL